MAFKRPENSSEGVTGKWSEESAFNTDLALKEAQLWIENVTGSKFPSDFQTSTKDGVFLCKLLNGISPGIIKQINTQKTAFAERENLSFFLSGCKQLGLKETQLFVSNDLYENQRIRTVAITLYWLGRAARTISTYKGPHLNLTAFCKMECSRCRKPIEGKDYVVTMNQQWHTNCAKCDNCSKPLSAQEGYYADKDKVLCPPCHDGKACHSHDHGHNCGNCGASTVGKNVVEAKLPGSNKTVELCPNCYCDVCYAPDKDLKDVKGRKICPKCRCDECGGPVEGPFVTNDKGKKVCSNCICDSCHHPTPSNKLKPKDGKKVCDGCYAPKSPGRGALGGPSQASPIGDCCKGCSKPLSGQVVQDPTNNNKYHPNCFKCSSCAQPFKDGKMMLVGGKPVCPGCHSKPKSPGRGVAPSSEYGNCHGCHQPITNPNDAMEACGNNYHNKCFKCNNCKKPIANGQYADVNNEPWCGPCASQAAQGGPRGGPGGPFGASPKKAAGPQTAGYIEGETPCEGCKKPLSGQVTNVYDKYWHFGCFKCDKCKVPLEKSYIPFANKPHCEKCYHTVAGSETCTRCKQPLEGRCLQVKNQKFHDKCFQCDNCKCSLSIEGTPVCSKFNNTFCAPCFSKKHPGNKEAPEPVYTSLYGDKQAGFTIDPRSGKKVMRTADGKPASGVVWTKYCNKCHTTMSEGQSFCSSCGHKAQF
eukprot:TRINITY_DN1850_c0_g1_i2.p1 TRINITY_DN1850_c0_g1~~TRINITY_DN1850_c0_g1_i2.p1  ORF type:complete len:700 (+),score=133.34 TRINITY_DN1850_c0_g1_i2:118-2217(+)